MKLIKDDMLNEINNLSIKWSAFKYKRNRHKFENKVAFGWLTMNQREDIIDRVFSILHYHTEDFKE